MKNRIATIVFTLLAIAANSCTRSIDVDHEKGIYAIFELPDLGTDLTKAVSYNSGSNTFSNFWKDKEKIDVFATEQGEQLIYSITPDPAKPSNCIFKVNNFKLLDGTYYSFSPTQGAIEDNTNFPVTFMGQVQDGDDNSDHLAKYDYNTASASIKDNAGNFTFYRHITWIVTGLTFPEDCVLESISLELSTNDFVAEATANVQAGTVSPSEYTDSLTLNFKEPVAVTAGVPVVGVITIFPITTTSPMKIVAHCQDGVTFEGATTVAAGTTIVRNKHTRVRRNMVKVTEPTPEPEGTKFEKVTAKRQLTAGDYLLVYKNGSNYNLFSFDKIMANAEEASKYVLGCTGIEHLAQHHTAIYQKTIGGNYETIAADEFNNDETLIVPADMNGVVISATGDFANGATTLTTTDGRWTLGLKKIEVDLAADGSALISTAFNPADVANILNTLRGHEIGITFEELIKYGAKEAALTSLQLEKVLKSFDKMCEIAKFEFTEHNVLDLMDIDRSTKIMDVFVNHYDDFIELAELYDDHRYGFAKPVGFFAADNGFTFNVPVPGSEWFERAQASFEAAMAAAAGKSDAEGWAAAKEAFVAYWAQFDSELHISSYPNVFSNLASRSVNAIDYSSFKVLASMNWTKFGGIYTQTVNMLNDPLENVCLYKKVN